MKFKKIYQILFVSFLLLLFSGGSVVQADQSLIPNTQSGDSTLRTVSVTGVGEVNTEADTVVFDLGVRTTEETAEAALASNNEQVASILDALRDEGLESSNLSTQSIQLFPRYDRDEDSQTLTNFEASNIIQVTLTDIDSLGEILDSAVQAGSNTINNIQFEASDKTELMAQARELAMEDAHDKAEQLVELADASLGSVVTIEEFSNTPRTPTANQVEFAQDAGSVPIEAGTQSIVVQVNVTWMIEVDGQSDGSASSPNVEISPASGPAGTEIELTAEGLPANTEVDLGVGRWRSEYDVVGTAQTSAAGTLNTTVAIPEHAEISEQWVAVVAVTQSSVKESSNVFLVTN